MTTVLSTNVKVFPCATRESDNGLDSKLLSEQNITNIIKSVTDNHSYIISWDNDTLKCVIKGYYFEISGQRIGGDLYAHLQMNGDVLNGADEVDGNQKYFAGLDINNSASNADLVLCVSGNIPIDSWAKFNPKSLNADLTRVDCGELN